MSIVPLRLVDPETGEMHEACPQCLAKDDIIAGLQTNIAGWTMKYAKLERDIEEDAAAHPLQEVARELFDYWRDECRHPNSDWDGGRFFRVLPFLKKPGVEKCRRAIDGAAFDPWTYRRKNGSLKRCDEWERIFNPQDRSNFEEFCNKAPRRAAA